jgi:hypothetical protein
VSRLGAMSVAIALEPMAISLLDDTGLTDGILSNALRRRIRSYVALISTSPDEFG